MDELRLRALEMASGREAKPGEIERVGRDTSADAASWAFQQWALRERARAKFSNPEAMFFDRDGLEMATHEVVAAYHASRFPEAIAVLDMTAGIGADTLALLKRGPVEACEADPKRAELLRANIGQEPFVGDGSERLGEFDYVWLDPMRRGGGKRLSAEQYEPNPWAIREQLHEKKLVGIKLSPMVHDSLLEELGQEIEFISFGGECREAIVWLGEQAVPGIRATQIETGETLARIEEEPQSDEADHFIFEADPAAIRVHALGQFGIPRLGEHPGYLTGSDHIVSPWITAYQTLWQGAFRIPKIQEACRELNLKITAVKKRGADIEPEEIRKKIKANTGEPVVLIVYGFERKLHAVLAKKLGTP